MRAAILSVCPHLDLRSFKELSAESTSLAGLEKDLLRYDELAVKKKGGEERRENNQVFFLLDSREL